MQPTAIIAAYNEAKTLKKVLDPVIASGMFSDVIVIDDGSTDETAEIARSCSATVLQNATNKGKDFSVVRAARQIHTQQVLLLDADLLGITVELLERIVTASRRADIVLCILKPNTVLEWVWFPFRYMSAHTGVRLVPSELLQSIPIDQQHKYCLESFLNRYARLSGFTQTKIVVPGIHHVIKEKKWGLYHGSIARMRMASDIVLFHVWYKHTR